MKRLITNGDSWTYGSELRDPKLVAELDLNNPSDVRKMLDLDFDSLNHPYRIANTWTTHLANRFHAEAINLGYPASNNNLIAERTMDYICANNLYGNQNFVVIGWTAPERNDYYMDFSPSLSRRQIFFNSLDKETHPPAIDYLKMYFEHMVVPDEYWARYIKNIVMVENFLKVRNIPYLMFNAFYSLEDLNSSYDWSQQPDFNMADAIKGRRNLYYYYSNGEETHSTFETWLSNLWASVDPVRWYRKDQDRSSFRTFAVNKVKPAFADGNCGHPNELAHKAWADELRTYILSNQLLKAPK